MKTRSSWFVNKESAMGDMHLRKNSFLTFGCLYIHVITVFDLPMVSLIQSDSNPSILYFHITQSPVGKIISDIDNQSATRRRQVLPVYYVISKTNIRNWKTRVEFGLRYRKIVYLFVDPDMSLYDVTRPQWVKGNICWSILLLMFYKFHHRCFTQWVGADFAILPIQANNDQDLQHNLQLVFN